MRLFLTIFHGNIAMFTPECRLNHVSTHARNHENAYSTTDYHLKWFSLETAVSEEGSSSNLYSCQDGESSVSESEDEQSSEPERDYDDHDVSPLVKIVCTARSRQLSTARCGESVFWCDRGGFTRKTARLHLAREPFHPGCH